MYSQLFYGLHGIIISASPPNKYSKISIWIKRICTLTETDLEKKKLYNSLRDITSFNIGHYTI